MKLSEYINNLTTLMMNNNAQDYDVKTRRIGFDMDRGFSVESVADLTENQFCVNNQLGVAFVDCSVVENCDITPMNEIMEAWLTPEQS